MTAGQRWGVFVLLVFVHAVLGNLYGRYVDGIIFAVVAVFAVGLADRRRF